MEREHREEESAPPQACFFRFLSFFPYGSSSTTPSQKQARKREGPQKKTGLLEQGSIWQDYDGKQIVQHLSVNCMVST
jgi:hypothetical protein